MRDLEKYQNDYKLMPFEAVQVSYRRKKVLEVLEFYKCKSILEIGCGEDSLINHFNDFESFVVVEPAAKFYRKAIRDSHRDVRIKVINKTLQSAVEDLKNYRFDMIILSSILHEIENSRELLEGVHEIASDTTLIHLNVPNANSFHRLLAVEMGLISNNFDKSDMQVKMQQSHVFDLRSLTELVEASGFLVKDSGSFFIKPFTHQQMEELRLSSAFPLGLFDGLYRMSKYLPNYGSEIYLNITRK